MGVERVLEAVEFATEAHHGVIRKFTNEPYVQHCIRVARYVAYHTWDEEYSYELENLYIAALLHDVLEDCPNITPEKIAQEFGGKVLGLVQELTDPPKSAGNRAWRKQITIERYKTASANAHTIKCADFLDNARSMVFNDVDFGPIWLKEKAQLLPFLNRAVPSIHWEATSELYFLEEYLEGRKNGLVSSTG